MEYDSTLALRPCWTTAQEVDEQLGAQHAVELAGARGVPAHEPLERGGLVGRVVVDVHARVGFPEGGDFVEDRLEDGLLLGRRCGPSAESGDVLPVGPDDRHPEEVLARAFVGEVVAFEVEEDVAGRGLGQAREAAALFDGQQLVDGRVGAAPRELDAGLALRLLERLLRALGRLERDGEAEVAEALERLDAVRLELAPVEARDAGDEGEVVVGVPALVALLATSGRRRSGRRARGSWRRGGPWCRLPPLPRGAA